MGVDPFLAGHYLGGIPILRVPFVRLGQMYIIAGPGDDRRRRIVISDLTIIKVDGLAIPLHTRYSAGDRELRRERRLRASGR